MATHTNIKPEGFNLLDMPKPPPSFQTASREEIEGIADQLISDNLEAFRELDIYE